MKRRDVLAWPLTVLWARPTTDRVTLVLRVRDGAVLYEDPDNAADANSTTRTWTVAPGSTVKPFVLQALLEAGRLRATETFLCSGDLKIGAHNLACSHPRGLPPLTIPHVLAYSCNAAVASFAGRFTPDELAVALRRYGFQVSIADVRLLALGEAGVSVTAWNLANAFRQLARNSQPVVREGMEDAVQFGTAQLAAIPGLAVAGKTGSSIDRNGLHAALFGGFAPSRAPEFVAVAILQGRSGGADAAPIAADLLRAATRPTAKGEPGYRVRLADRVVDFSVEEYVSAVLGGEATTLVQPEALKAIAVAARTYAAHQRGRHWKDGYDFCNTTHCQRAEPTGITAAMRSAAKATEGQVLRFQQSVAFTPYSLSCGGRSESAAVVWPEDPAPYLRVHPDPYCPVVSWTRDLPCQDVERALRQSDLRCPNHLARVSVLTRSSSGRVRELRLEGESAETISAGAFRFAVGRGIGWNLVRSDWFDVVSTSAYRIRLQGRGEGNGVGLCQRGAEAMGARGFSFRDILQFYYPGLSGVAWLRMGGESIAVYGTDLTRDRIVLTMAEQIITQLPWRWQSRSDIYVHPTTGEFRAATREPGWVAAHTEGQRIDLQPVQTLERAHLLQSTLRHELLHIAVESRAVPGLPIWFREGVVEWLAGGHDRSTPRLASTDEVRNRENREQATAAYRDARAQVSQLVSHYGERTVLGWISTGLPAAVKNAIASSAPTKSR